MKILSAIVSLFISDDGPDGLMDHVPVNGDGQKLSKLRARAKLRHGRPFHCDEVKAREAPKSRTLEEIEDKAPKKPENVTPIKTRAAK